MYQEISEEHKNPLAVVSGKANVPSQTCRHPLWRRVNKEAANNGYMHLKRVRHKPECKEVTCSVLFLQTCSRGVHVHLSRLWVLTA